MTQNYSVSIRHQKCLWRTYGYQEGRLRGKDRFGDGAWRIHAAAAAAKSLQSCPTLCDPMDSSLPGSSIHGIFWATVLEWGAIAFSHPLHAAACQVASVLSDSVRPHGLQPTRLLRPWDSPGKNTGVGCHFLLGKPKRSFLISKLHFLGTLKI